MDISSCLSGVPMLDPSYWNYSSEGKLHTNPLQYNLWLQFWVCWTQIRAYLRSVWFIQLVWNLKFTFRPFRLFQHKEGRFLCRASRGRKCGHKSLFLVYRSQNDALFDHLTKFYTSHKKFIFQIKLLIEKYHDVFIIFHRRTRKIVNSLRNILSKGSQVWI
jgi:hypothetical protein